MKPFRSYERRAMFYKVVLKKEITIQAPTIEDALDKAFEELDLAFELGKDELHIECTGEE